MKTETRPVVVNLDVRLHEGLRKLIESKRKPGGPSRGGITAHVHTAIALYLLRQGEDTGWGEAAEFASWAPEEVRALIKDEEEKLGSVTD